MSNITITRTTGRAKPVDPTPPITRVDREGPYTFTLRGYDLWITADHDTRLPFKEEDLNTLADIAVGWARTVSYGLYELYRVVGDIGERTADLDTGAVEDLVGVVTFGESGFPLPRDPERRAEFHRKVEENLTTVTVLLDTVGVTTVNVDEDDPEDTETVFTAISGVIDRAGFLPSGI